MDYSCVCKCVRELSFIWGFLGLILRCYLIPRGERVTIANFTKTGVPEYVQLGQEKNNKRVV